MKKLMIAGFSALMLVAFSVPAMADMKIGGIVFTDFYWLDEDKEAVTTGGVAKGATTIEEDRTNMQIDVPNITRLYARWTNEDNVGLYIEYGLGDTSTAGGDGGASLRHAYGWWQATPAFRLMAGHSTTPFSPLTPSQLIGTRSGHLNIIGIGYGEFYSGRFQQVRGSLSLPNDMGRIELALVDPNGGADPAVLTEGRASRIAAAQAALTSAAAAFDAAPTAANLEALVAADEALSAAESFSAVDSDTTIPRIDLAADIYIGSLKLYPGVFWQRKTYDNVVAGADDDVTSWGASIGIAWGMGPFSFEGEYQLGENWANTRGLSFHGLPWGGQAGAHVDGNGKIEDAECSAWWADLGFKVMPNVAIHGVIGQFAVENDRDPAVGDETDINSMMYGISVPIDLAKGFRARPEIFFYDDGDDEVSGTDTDFGSYVIYGVQFQITF